MIQFEPPFMPIHTALLALGCAAVVLALYVRRDLGLSMDRPGRVLALAAIRGVLLLAMAIILLNPVIVARGEATKGKRPFVVLFDTSRSMCTEDVGGGTRYEAARRATLDNAAMMADLAAKYDLRFFSFADKPEAAPAASLAGIAKPNGARTNLGAAIAGALTPQPPLPTTGEGEQRNLPSPVLGGGAEGGGQLLIVSDGRDTSDSFPLEAARAAKAQGFAVHTLCVGQKTELKDLAVVARKTQVYASPNQPVQLAAEIRDSGISGARVAVDLLQDGRKVAGQTVAVEPGRKEVSFPVTQAKKGLYRYAIRVAAAPEERNEANNRASIFLNVMNEKARVLFLEGRPSWDSKFLAQALRTDPTVSLDVIYKLTDTKFFAVLGGESKEAGITLPKTPEALAKYDLLILGKGFEEFYDEAGIKALKSWIADHGGNLLLLRGRPDDNAPSLRELEPVTWSDTELADLRLRLTQEGRSHPAFAFAVSDDAQTVVRKLPPLISATRVQGEKALAVVLARSDSAGWDEGSKEMATLAYQRFGQGKVMAIVGQGLWRWAFLPPDLESYGKVYNEFWTQTVRWMVSESDFLPGQDLSIRTDRSSYAANDAVNLLAYRRGHHGGAPPSLTIQRPDGVLDHVAMAAGDGKTADFTASYRPVRPGEYIASLPAPGANSSPISCLFTVYPGQEEDLNRSADPDLMRQIAAAGGGQVVTLAEVSGLPERLRVEEQSRERKAEPKTAWDRPWVLASLIGLLAIEWWLRRRSGLV